MKIYKVGGCVRDMLLGLDPKDIDYVVVGGTEQEMIARGFTKVGADFPVFLHPVTGEEYALARKERKTGVGYNGFSVVFDPTVTLEEDLSRRDLTINAMAYDPETKRLIDPFDGHYDLLNGTLRHVSDAFAEDPVRVLRTARFAARYDFDVHHTTLALMREVVAELDHVPQERIWAEFHKGLSEDNPLEMISVLSCVGAFETNALRAYGGADEELMRSVLPLTPLTARFAVLASKFTREDYARCCIPTEYARVAAAFNDCIDTLIGYDHTSVEKRVKMFERLRAFSQTELLDDVLVAFELTAAKGILVGGIIKKVRTDLDILRSVDAAAIVGSLSGDRSAIGPTIFAERCEALKRSDRS